MRKSSLVGLITGFGLVLGAILLGSGWTKFLDPASLLIVTGGTASAVAVSRPFSDLKRALGNIVGIFTFSRPSFQRHIDQLKNFGRIARREGVLALDQRLEEVDNELLRFGLELAVDGMDADEIHEMLNQRIGERRKQRQVTPGILSTAGTYSPAFGMVGTLIGLIQMLQNLDDPTQIGAGMATALVTTFYGALLGNLVFLPLSDRAKVQNELQAKVEHIVREGVLCIARGDSPRMIEQRLTHLVHEDTVPEEAEQSEPAQTGASERQPAAAAA